MSKKGIYLNEFHRRQHEQAKAFLSKQLKQSLAQAMKQYGRIKRSSTRTRRASASATKVATG